jgi:hypothetical protein
MIDPQWIEYSFGIEKTTSYHNPLIESINQIIKSLHDHDIDT